MPIRYKINVLDAIKAAGYSTWKIRKEHIISEGNLQNIRDGKIVNAANLSKICEMLDCQPGDILEYYRDETVEESADD